MARTRWCLPLYVLASECWCYVLIDSFCFMPPAYIYTARKLINICMHLCVCVMPGRMDANYLTVSVIIIDYYIKYVVYMWSDKSTTSRCWNETLFSPTFSFTRTCIWLSFDTGKQRKEVAPHSGWSCGDHGSTQFSVKEAKSKHAFAAQPRRAPEITFEIK